MRQLEVLVEEQSAAELLGHLLPLLLYDEIEWAIHSFSGKTDLLRKLPARLRGYKARLEWQPGLRIVVLVDRDEEGCDQLKAKLEEIASSVGLQTKSTAADFTVVNRVAIEEIEAWYFGDVPALRSLYPRIPASLADKAGYRDPDAIAGGTWECLERLLQRYGYERGGLRKVALAGDIGPLMDPASNRSRSFQVFVEGIRACAA